MSALGIEPGHPYYQPLRKFAPLSHSQLLLGLVAHVTSKENAGRCGGETKPTTPPLTTGRLLDPLYQKGISLSIAEVSAIPTVGSSSTSLPRYSLNVSEAGRRD